MERANRPNGFTIPEESGQFPARHEDDDIRVQLNDIRKEIEETNRTLKRIAEGLERGRR